MRPEEWEAAGYEVSKKNGAPKIPSQWNRLLEGLTWSYFRPTDVGLSTFPPVLYGCYTVSRTSWSHRLPVSRTAAQ